MLAQHASVAAAQQPIDKASGEGSAIPSRTVCAVQLQIERICRDGNTQARTSISQRTISEYAALMSAGIEFPPVRVWSDGHTYWLTDGFQRVAAAEIAGQSVISAEVRQGSLSDAKWDSYSANATHGIRRTRQDMKMALSHALEHPNATQLSNNQLSRHLGIPEATVRRWRQQISSSNDEDAVRTASRAGRLYSIHTSNIGKRVSHAPRLRPKSATELRAGLREMKAKGSLEARRILTVCGNWAIGRTTAPDCLAAIERIIGGWIKA